MIGTLSY